LYAGIAVGRFDSHRIVVRRQSTAFLVCRIVQACVASAYTLLGLGHRNSSVSKHLYSTITVSLQVQKARPDSPAQAVVGVKEIGRGRSGLLDGTMSGQVSKKGDLGMGEIHGRHGSIQVTRSDLGERQAAASL
jgi:hypothetical protein